MRKLLYDVLELPVRLVNPVTAKERESNKLLAHVIMNHKESGPDMILTLYRITYSVKAPL